MKLNLSGKINKIYVQSLCMMFYHGVKFPENEENTDGLELTVNVSERKNAVQCTAFLKSGDKEVSKEAKCEFTEEESADRTYKIAIGQAVYMACACITGRSSGYGILTGIRPSKVVAALLESHTEKETRDILLNRYLLSCDKTDLCIEVAKNETAILKRTDDGKCSIYISIPFCPSRCNYCSFISYAGKKLFSLIPSYLDKLNCDIRKTFDTVKKCGLTVSCIYIGGGTPTILDPSQLEDLLSTVGKCIDTSTLDEYTLEGGRPDTITDEKLLIAKRYGITRISVNPQTLNDTVLEKIGRRHTVEDFLTAYEKVKRSGIDCINTDLIAGLDYDDFESFKSTVDRIIELDPDRDGGMLDCVLEESDDAFAEYLRLREIRLRDAAAAEVKIEKASDAKQDYEQKKRENAERRALEKKIERAKKKIEELEGELERLDEELFGEAASDYVRAAEIDKRKSEIEEELLELYELVM